MYTGNYGSRCCEVVVVLYLLTVIEIKRLRCDREDAVLYTICWGVYNYCIGFEMILIPNFLLSVNHSYGTILLWVVVDLKTCYIDSDFQENLSELLENIEKLFPKFTK